ncbi:hypothetical protein KKF38_05385 [Patescibacteria group bacterium]|nr:hypothetical protein [Patescibacteria group bacterium]
MPNIHIIFNHTTDDGIKGELGIDDNSNLYWNGKMVTTKSKVSLGWWVNIFIIIASLSTLVMAIFAVLEFCYPS